ncbi:unnamed protein product [Paramecium octaurelia]|uniref:Mitochondrial carrier protein n=1 Tax=Paramecium octaurelia TaxID=43137 RepID=A0A8S1TXT6_PAROT|nr:unnamed protein product [Paramecium octaurelia]
MSGKDFSQFLSNKDNQSIQESVKKSIDPNLFINEQTLKQIEAETNKHFWINYFTQSIVTTFVAPLTTIYTSLQLSVIPHQNKYGDLPEESGTKTSTQLVKTTRDIQPHEKRKFELLIKSGAVGSNKPFRAPIYTTYREAFQGLTNQGWQAFFKGNLIGIIHLLANSHLKIKLLSDLDFRLGAMWHEGNQLLRQAVILGLVTVSDLVSNPFMLFQSRFILQNRLPNFYLYKNLLSAFKKHVRHKKEYFQGSTTYLYKNGFIFLAQVPIQFSQKLEQFQMLYLYLSYNLISYPFLTIVRRLHCQSTLPGMIPIRYSGPFHALRLITQEEGIRGLYRGFGLYLVGSGVLQYIMFGTQIDQGDF